MEKLTFRNVFDEVLENVMNNNEEGLKEAFKKYNFKSVDDCVIYAPSSQIGIIVPGDTNYKGLLEDSIKESEFFYLSDKAQISQLGGIEFDITKGGYGNSWRITNSYSLRKKPNLLHSMQEINTKNRYDSGEHLLSYLLGRELTIIDKMIIGEVGIPEGPRTSAYQHSHDFGYIMPAEHGGRCVLKKFCFRLSPEIETPIKHADQSGSYRGINSLL